MISIFPLKSSLYLTDDLGIGIFVFEKQGRFEREYADHFTLSALATQYHISTSHLSHIFKSVTGYAPIEYLMICRLSAAKNLLSSTDKGIKEIIDLCGFSDESNFSRTFREKVGMTPTEFRKMT